jgi:SAM-dependent methyltransferase
VGGYRRALGAGLTLAWAAGTALAQQPSSAAGREGLDGGPYVPTPPGVVQVMLNTARVGAKDTVYDLGSGDGRLVIEAARRGARAVGLERNAELVAKARAAAREAGVAGRVCFVEADIFRADLREATVVTLYLLPAMLAELAPKLAAELPPGARVVSHDFPVPGWQPADTLYFESEEKERVMGFGGTHVYLYRAPGPVPRK